MKKALKILAIIVLSLVVIVAAAAAYVKWALPNVGDAPNIKVAQSPENIERGRYLANHVMVCMDCHSTRNWMEFSGPMVPGTTGMGGDRFDKNQGFPGTYYAANITPAGIGNWTDGEIFRAITCGVKRDGKPIFPVMPHKNYGQLDETDIEAVIAYLRTLTSIENKVPESVSDFPMNFIINTMPSKAELKPKPSPNDQVAYGKYLVTAAACGDCHTPFEGGSYIEKYAMAGGRSFALPAGTLMSANLTPDKETGIGKWSRDEFLDRFRLFRDSAAAHRPADIRNSYNTMMPWTMYAGMTDEDLSAVYAYLQTLQPIEHRIKTFTPR